MIMTRKGGIGPSEPQTTTIWLGKLSSEVQELASAIGKDKGHVVKEAVLALLDLVRQSEPRFPRIAAEIIYARKKNHVPLGVKRSLTFEEASKVFRKGEWPLPDGVAGVDTDDPGESIPTPAFPEFTPEEVARGEVKRAALLKRAADDAKSAAEKSKLTPEGPPSNFGKSSTRPANPSPAKPGNQPFRRPRQPDAT